jgi:hypothetical protein
MTDLRSKLIRLANEQPELREHLLPLLAKEAGSKTAGTITLAMNIKDAAVALRAVVSRPEYTDEEEIAAFVMLMHTCSLYARRALKNTAAANIILVKVEDALQREIDPFDTPPDAPLDFNMRVF